MAGSQCPPGGEGKPPSGQRAGAAVVLIQVTPAEPLTSGSLAGGTTTTSPGRTSLLGDPRGGGGAGGGGSGAEGRSNPAGSPPSGDSAHKPAKRRSPSLWRSRSTVWLRRSWSGQTKSGRARKEEEQEQARARSATPQTSDPRDGLRLQAANRFFFQNAHLSIQQLLLSL